MDGRGKGDGPLVLGALLALLQEVPGLLARLHPGSDLQQGAVGDRGSLGQPDRRFPGSPGEAKALVGVHHLVGDHVGVGIVVDEDAGWAAQPAAEHG